MHGKHSGHHRPSPIKKGRGAPYYARWSTSISVVALSAALAHTCPTFANAEDAIVLPLPLETNQRIHAAQAIEIPAADLPPTAPGTAPEPVVESPDILLDDLLILQVRLNNLILSEGQLGYRMGNSACLYLEDFARAMEFPIVYDFDTRRAEGWFIAERNRFELDIPAGTVRAGKKTFSIEAGDLQHVDDGPCVSLQALMKWLPLEIAIDFEDAIVFVDSLRPLPVEQRLSRERRRAGLDRLSAKTEKGPALRPPYKWLDMPVMDVFLDGSVGRTGGHGGPTATGGYELFAAGDFLKLSGEIAVSGNSEDPLSNVRVILGRRDPEGEAFGAVGLTEFAIGDVSTVQTPLSAQNELGRGLLISNFLLDQPDEFDRITLRGALLEGWEVELYRNDILLDFRLSSVSGRYEFLDVPLQFGRNRFVLVFYGPEGQRREEVKEVYVGSEMLTPGDVRLRTVINQQDRNVFGSQLFNEDPDAGELRAVTQIDVGLLKNLSAGANYATFSFEGTRKHYAGATLTAGLSAFALRLDATAAQDRGYALGGAAQGRLGPLNLFGRHEYFRDFESERAAAAGDDLLRDRSEARIDTIIPLLGGFGLPFGVEAERQRRQSGLEETELSSRVSSSFGTFSTTNNVNFLVTRAPDGTEEEAGFGSFLFNLFAAPFFFRGDVAYDYVPTRRLTNFSLTSEWDVRPDLNLRLTGLHDLRTDLSTASASLNKRFKHVSLAANSTYSTDDSYEVGLALNFSIGHNPLKERWEITSRKRSEFGAVVAHACIDEDQDKTCTEFDTPLEDARFQIDGQRLDMETNADGAAFVPALPTYADSVIGVDIRSIKDPYIIPSRSDVRMITRPGPVTHLDFTFLQTGEVDGTVLMRRSGGTLRGAADVQLELVAEDGAIAAKTRSEFDGFFLFERVPLGAYRLQVSADQMDRLKLLAPPAADIALTVEESLSAGHELVLLRQKEGAITASTFRTVPDQDAPNQQDHTSEKTAR